MDTEIFKILSDETRLRIINLLLDKDLCVCEIEMVLNISQSNISRHLSKLKSAGIVISEKDAQWVYYKLDRNFEVKNLSLFCYLRDVFMNEPICYYDKERLNSQNYMSGLCN